MDYKEEQNGEIEALMSIYEGEIEVLRTAPHHVFTMPIKTENFEEDEEDGLFILIKITYTPKYPEELPLLELEECVNIDEYDLRDELLEHLTEQMEENIGMVMGFTVISAALEWLGSTWDTLQKEEEERIRRKKELDDDEEKKRLEGTKVTIESFLAWKAEFDAERQMSKKVAVDVGEKRLTGKELFLQNLTLNDSDLKFLSEGPEDNVEVDESLFDDLDLDGEEFDDDDSDDAS